MNTLSRFFNGELGIKQLPTVVAAYRDPARRPFVIQALVVEGVRLLVALGIWVYLVYWL